MSKNKRSLFLHVNRFQQYLLYPVLLTCLLACGISFYSLYYIHYIDNHLLVACNIDFNRLEREIPWIMNIRNFNTAIPFFLMTICLMLFLMIFWLYYVSNKLVGPYERVLRELDEVVAGKHKNPIGLREGDDLFKELLKRINPIIAKLP